MRKGCLPGTAPPQHPASLLHPLACLRGQRAHHLCSSSGLAGASGSPLRVRTPWVGAGLGGAYAGEQFCDGDREEGEREEGAHLRPPPPRRPAQGEAPARAREGGQTVVLSLASGRPAPHNDPFIGRREPCAGVSSDKGGRPACPLAGGVGVSPIQAGPRAMKNGGLGSPPKPPQLPRGERWRAEGTGHRLHPGGSLCAPPPPPRHHPELTEGLGPTAKTSISSPPLRCHTLYSEHRPRSPAGALGSPQAA